MSREFFREAQQKWIWIIFLVQILLLCVAGYRNRGLNDFDGTAYTRIAHYYATGDTHLMVSGYWGPLFSWLMVPWLWLGMHPLHAARIASGLSALVFQYGSISVLRAFAVAPRWQLLGASLSAVASVSWSVMFVSPDLLVSGLVCIAISKLVDTRWATDGKVAFHAGLIWGIAYLAKAVAFPIALGISICFAALFIAIRTAARNQILKQLAITMSAFFLVAGPWIFALSVKYQRFTFSESARVAHAVIGPPDVDRYHPIGKIMYRPEPGRVTAWEDPSRMPYHYWSPLQSPSYAAHQLRHIASNCWVVWCRLSDSDFLSIGLCAALAGAFLPRKNWREILLRDRWRWVLVPLVCVIGIYLPVHANESRFYYVTVPLFIILAAGLHSLVASKCPAPKALIGKLVFALVLVSFGLPALLRLSGAIAGYPDGSIRNARVLAEKLQATAASGPLIGNPAEFATDWVALLTGQPWYGGATTPESCRESGAALLVLRRHSFRSHAFESEPGFQNLDSVLFASKVEAEAFPVRVFRIVGQSNAGGEDRSK